MHTDKDLQDVARIMMAWTMNYNKGRDFEEHDDDIRHTVIFSAIHSKIAMSGMKIIVPDELIVLFILLTDGNPGQSILLFKEMLENVAKRNGSKVRPGYLIQPMDVGLTWPSRWPFMQDQDINDKYHKKWLAQKKPREGFSDNMCDMPQWWREVYEE